MAVVIRYLVDLGLPIEVCDRKGNTPVHSCIKYGLKRKRFEKCCKLLVCLLESNLELLYVRNNEGTSPSYLLEQLWQESTPEERNKGDALASCRSVKRGTGGSPVECWMLDAIWHLQCYWSVVEAKYAAVNSKWF
ncbi:unnamed protein product [Rodentolepis nana]|uniref:ANK_REP_REGION domain-containing protein n=1 Tax=Rodentolepis nana TaxID=102285 RepID=A0A0R3TRK5_RODNA|nr:unnamed protein product [Rodentolepis nana]